jgi:hypothetical protein
MKIQIIKTGTATSKQNLSCPYMIDEAPLAKK